MNKKLSQKVRTWT